MLRDVPASEHLKLESSDLEHYLVLQEVAQMLECGETLRVLESGPIPPKSHGGLRPGALLPAGSPVGTGSRGVLARLLRDSSGLLLSWKAIEAYRAVDAGNARLRWLAGIQSMQGGGA